MDRNGGRSGNVDDELTWDASAGIFMSGGPEDPENALIEITAVTAEFWESPGKIATVVRLAKGIVTDDKPDTGKRGVVEL